MADIKNFIPEFHIILVTPNPFRPHLDFILDLRPVDFVFSLPFNQSKMIGINTMSHRHGIILKN